MIRALSRRAWTPRSGEATSTGGRILLSLVVLLLVATMLGCSRTPTYEARTACSIASDDVAALLDTDQFVAESGQFPELPTGIPAGSRVFNCTASGGDRDLLAGVDLVGSVTAERARALIERSPRTFPIGEGVGVIDATGAMWTCGSVVARVEVRKQDRSAGLEVKSRALRAAIGDLAGAAGCAALDDE